MNNPDGLKAPSNIPNLCCVIGPGKGLIQSTPTKRKQAWWCMDCLEVYPEFFMVKDTIWYQVFRRPDSGIICWDCFEVRLGRSLRMDDLSHSRLNQMIRKGYDLGLKDGAEAEYRLTQEAL